MPSSKGKKTVPIAKKVKQDRGKKQDKDDSKTDCIQSYLARLPNSFPFIVGRNTAPWEIAFYPSRGKAVDHDGQVWINPVYRKDDVDQPADVSLSMFQRITQPDILTIDADDDLVVLFREHVGPNLSVRLARRR